MSCKDKDGGTHHYACECREKFYNEDRLRMIRAFQEIQKVSDDPFLSHEQRVEKIKEICREAIAPREKK